ncbi:MAG: hypothetical protein ACI88H_001801, partial [Cocleimonas sp.]
MSANETVTEKNSLNHDELRQQESREQWMLLGFSIPAILVVIAIILIP